MTLTAKQRAEKFSDRDFNTMYGWRLRELIAAEMEAYASERVEQAAEEEAEKWISLCERQKAALTDATNAVGIINSIETKFAKAEAYDDCLRIAKDFTGQGQCVYEEIKRQKEQFENGKV